MDSEEVNITIAEGGAKVYRNSEGKLHRLDGPAVEFEDGGEAWWKNGKRHRVGGPAVSYPVGYREWRYEGLLHRVDGPAVIYSDGEKEWVINDIVYATKEVWFDALSDKDKAKCLFSEDFLNG
jgi:hypothetical protein